MFTLVLVIVVISILVLVHEWGHFYSARLFKVKVEEFGFGFPPRVFSVVKNGIRYSFNLLPLGGFVRIFGERGEGEGSRDSFISRPAWQRFVILGAGVFMNLVLAWVFYSVSSGIGVPRAVEGDLGRGVLVSVVGVVPGLPAEKAGLKIGDEVIEMRSRDVSLRIEEVEDVIGFTDAYRGEEVTVVVKRADAVREFQVTPRSQVPKDEGPMGIMLGKLVVKSVPWYLAPFEGAKVLYVSTSATVSGLGFIVHELLIEGKTDLPVSGPLGIFFLTQDSLTLGVSFFLQFVGTLSVSLAVLNILPIPALDGGRILFLAIEKLKGKRISPTVENLAHAVGFVVLILLVILVTYKDVTRAW